MTANDFITAIEAYYGQYPKEAQRAAVMAYAKMRSPEFLLEMSQYIFETYSTRYNTVPAIAEFKEVTGEVMERLEKKIQARKTEMRITESRKLLTTSGISPWDEVEYQGRVMTRSAAYMQCLLDGMKSGINPRNNLTAMQIKDSPRIADSR